MEYVQGERKLKIKKVGLQEDKQRLENLSCLDLPSFLSYIFSAFICCGVGINGTHSSLSCDYFAVIELDTITTLMPKKA